MSLKSTAQQLIVVDPSMEHSVSHSKEHDGLSLVPLEVSDNDSMGPSSMDPMEVHEQKPMELEIVMELPGAPPGTKDPEPILEVSEPEEEHKAEDQNDAKKNEKWDWSKRGTHGFIAWVKERCDDVPKHSGYDSAGLERAVAYLERLDNEVSKAMKMDLDGELDADKIEKVRAIIDNGIERLHDRLDKVKTSKKKTRKKKSEDMSEGMIKEAQKITGVHGIVVTVDLLTSHIARVCINGMVSAGHDIEDLYARQVKEFGLNKREQACVIQLLDDMGYAMRRDRGYMPDEDIDVADSGNMDWAAQYKA